MRQWRIRRKTLGVFGEYAKRCKSVNNFENNNTNSHIRTRTAHFCQNISEFFLMTLSLYKTTDLKFRPLVDEAVELGLALAQPPPQLPVRAAQLFVLAAHLTHTQSKKRIRYVCI